MSDQGSLPNAGVPRTISRMDTYSVLFPDSDPAATRLHSVARSIAASRARRRIRAKVEDEVGALGLVLLSLVGTLVEKGVLTRDELLAHLRRVDELDGVADGKVTPEQLRVALGITPPEPEAPIAPVPKRRRS